MTIPASRSAADNVLHLPDGRRLGYAEYGIPNGMPVLFFHGAPGSRHSIFTDMAAAAAQQEMRLIAPERPSYGLSDPLSGRSFCSWTDDVMTLTETLGIQEFKVIGFSMGSPYALACAHFQPARVKKVAIVGGLAPIGIAGVTTGMSASVRSLYDLARSDPSGLRETMAPLASSPSVLREVMAASSPVADQTLLAAHSPEFEADFAEAIRSGIDGIAGDFVLAAGEWAFPLDEIEAKVDFWIGSEDCNTPVAMSIHLASAVPHSQLFELPGEGHFCLYKCWEKILDRLTSRD